MLNERKLSENEIDARLGSVKGLLKNKRALVKKYGKDAEKVMYGIATKQAKKKVENMNLDKIRGMVEDALKSPVKETSPFVLAADAARDAGKKEFEFPKGSGKMHPVTIKKDIDEASKEEEDKFHTQLDKLVHKTFGKGKHEKGMKENRFLAASMEDLEQVIRNLAHTGEMSEDEAIEMAIKKLEAMLDGRDDLDEGEVGEEDKLAGKIQKALNKGIINKIDAAELRKALNNGDLDVVKKANLDEKAESSLEEGIDYDRDEMERKGFDLYPGGRSEAWRYATEELGIPADEILGKLSDDVVYDAIYHSMQIMGMLGDDELDESSLKEEADHDIGHQDDEPKMLKSDLYRIAKYAAELYKMMDAYDDMDHEVDFPHWWQAKVIKARDYMVGAKHYLDGEEKVDQIDAMLDGPVEEKTYKINKESLKQKIKEKLTKKTRMKSYIKDFAKSKAPQFKGKSKEKKREMAVAAKLAKQDK